MQVGEVVHLLALPVLVHTCTVRRDSAAAAAQAAADQTARDGGSSSGIPGTSGWERQQRAQRDCAETKFKVSHTTEGVQCGVALGAGAGERARDG